MSSRIKIENYWTKGKSMLIGLSVESDEKFPIVVGCSLRSVEGEIVDIPARFLLSPGFALWGHERVDQRFTFPQRAKSKSDMFYWSGSIIFALYKDHTFATRLADTGWVECEWYSVNAFGSSQEWPNFDDDEILHAKKTKYFERAMEVWASLPDNSPIDIWKPFLKYERPR